MCITEGTLRAMFPQPCLGLSFLWLETSTLVKTPDSCGELCHYLINTHSGGWNPQDIPYHKKNSFTRDVTRKRRRRQKSDI